MINQLIQNYRIIPKLNIIQGIRRVIPNIISNVTTLEPTLKQQ